jgi:hypothetical protein
MSESVRVTESAADSLSLSVGATRYLVVGFTVSLDTAYLYVKQKQLEFGTQNLNA